MFYLFFQQQYNDQSCNMAINYRVGTIIIAAITIIGAIFDSVQLFFPAKGDTKHFQYLNNVKLHQALSVIGNLLSLMSSSCLYFVISIDIKTNVQRRRFLIPYCVWGFIVCIWRFTAFTLLVLRFGNEIDNVTYAMWLGGAIIMFLFAVVEFSYYRLLSHDNGSRLDSKSLVLNERPFQLRKYRLGVTGRIYYNDDEEVVAGKKKKKKDKKGDKDFLRSKKGNNCPAKLTMYLISIL